MINILVCKQHGGRTKNFVAYAEAPETSAHHLNNKCSRKCLVQNLWPSHLPQLFIGPQRLWLSFLSQADFQPSKQSQSMLRLQLAASQAQTQLDCTGLNCKQTWYCMQDDSAKASLALQAWLKIQKLAWSLIALGVLSSLALISTGLYLPKHRVNLVTATPWMPNVALSLLQQPGDLLRPDRKGVVST